MGKKPLGFMGLMLVMTIALTFLAKAAPAGSENNINGLLPNEMGEIMILEYHLIGYPEGDWRRTPENFRRDLEALYRDGYYPVNLRDVVSDNLNVPKGKTPVVLTFDDSSAGQLRFIPDGDRWRIDPSCAIGIMMDFQKKHPDFPAKGTFFVLPEIKKGLRLFGQEEYIKDKLEFLQKHGFEIGNHTYWHQNLGKASDDEVRRQLALAQQSILKYLPNYRMTSLSLPFGVWPQKKELAVAGRFEDAEYRHNAIVLVGSGPAPSLYSKSFNPLAIERIQAGDTPWGPGAYLKRYQKHPEKRFISDGNSKVITVPKEAKANISPKWSHRQIITR